ncbi:zinc ribbon domain-containing protein [Diaphorobacter sp.]|uniref:zinc ribbon domain-containing protein n=1 Tax=Diaphorobacter sp. TaxID=1934310 RepID=UPI0028AE6EED|nr:zinc ribbon domain-containing protein [Diaphorobacter sp.]
MALMKCPECGQNVSTQARTCPACGYPLKADQRPMHEQPALQSPHVWGRVATALGAWLVTPWIAKLIVALAVCVLAYFMFTGK